MLHSAKGELLTGTMTREQIEAKLRGALYDGIAREADVVYVLSEIRKILNGIREQDQHFALLLYCHWALHVDLTKSRITLPFLSRVDRFIRAELSRREMNVAEQHQMFREFVFLDTFRRELRHFFQRYQLPTEICDDDIKWREFVKLYTGVIEDGSLYCGAETDDLKLIKGVTFSKGRRIESENYFPFHLHWTVWLTQGKNIELEVNAAAMQNGEDMIIHSMTLAR